MDKEEWVLPLRTIRLGSDGRIEANEFDIELLRALLSVTPTREKRPYLLWVKSEFIRKIVARQSNSGLQTRGRSLTIKELGNREIWRKPAAAARNRDGSYPFLEYLDSQIELEGENFQPTYLKEHTPMHAPPATIEKLPWPDDWPLDKGEAVDRMMAEAKKATTHVNIRGACKKLFEQYSTPWGAEYTWEKFYELAKKRHKT